jgi:hypothetical protein
MANDEGLAELLKELEAFPCGRQPAEGYDAEFGGLIVPLKIRTDAGTLSFFTATTVFGTAVDITFSELMIESFMPGDAFTAETVREMAEGA